VWGAHLSENFVQPLQRAVEMELDPTRGAGDVLAMVLGAPPLDEAHPDRAHLGEFVDRLEAMVHRLTE